MRPKFLPGLRVTRFFLRYITYTTDYPLHIFCFFYSTLSTLPQPLHDNYMHRCKLIVGES
jgi:hypothetical protein